MLEKIIKIVSIGVAGVLSAVTVLGAYTPNYTTSDMDDIFADMLGSFGVSFIPFMSLVVLVIILVYVVKSWKKVRGR